MTYQDQLIKHRIDELERAIFKHIKQPCIMNAQGVASAKHAIHELIKKATNAK